MKTLLIAALAGYAGLTASGWRPCPCELVQSRLQGDAESRHFESRGGESVGPEAPVRAAAPVTASDTRSSGATSVGAQGLYLEARNATVWGGACHIGSEAVSQGTHAVMGWAFGAGELEGVRVAAAVQGSSNLQGVEVFGTGEVPELRAALWIDAPDERRANLAARHVLEAAELPGDTPISLGPVTVDRQGDAFRIGVDGVLDVEGDAMPDRSCCTMPESVWYAPLDDATRAAIVGNPDTCRFRGLEGHLEAWAFEGENSAFLASLGT